MLVRHRALELLQWTDPRAKVAGTRALWSLCRDGLAQIDTTSALAEPDGLQGLPGRPLRPRLVPPQKVPARSAQHAVGRAALLHAIAHIEFNAINLALDAVWRFAGLPQEFYIDWLRVAHEEALHFTLLTDHLATLDHDYGDWDAHDGLWQMAEATKADPLARMALVPRTLEARGLDATPLIQTKLAAAGDQAAVAILDIILRDEIGHVAIGNRWFRWLCADAGQDPEAIYPELARRYRAPRLRPPFNRPARLAAGFTERELDAQALASAAPTAPGRG